MCLQSLVVPCPGHIHCDFWHTLLTLKIEIFALDVA